MDAQELFWDIKDDGLTCPPLTESMLRDAEHQLGFVLPKSLTAVLKVKNGGILRPNRFYVGTDIEIFPEADAEGYISISTILGICRQNGINKMVNGKIWNEYMKYQWGYPEKSVVISHEGHGGIALLYEDIANPEVISVYSEKYPSVLIRNIAPNFEEFLSKLELT